MSLEDTIREEFEEPDPPVEGKIATCSNDTTVRIWDLKRRREILTLTDHKDIVYAVSASPDGQYIASCSEDKTIKLWQVNDGKLIRTYEYKYIYYYRGHTDGVTYCTFSNDSFYIASAGSTNDLSIKLWCVHPEEYEVTKYIKYNYI